jgi:predicted 2-oxoglutarate/Fe(II)-dependent dioxygenase YbiX
MRQLEEYNGVFNKNLNHYIYKEKNFLTDIECKNGIIELNDHKDDWQEHEFYEPNEKKWVKLSKNFENDIKYAEDGEFTKLIVNKLWFSIDRYIKFLNMPWFSGWSGYTFPRYNKYFNEKKMASHCDHIQSIFDGEKKGIPILSCLGILNEEYEGGKFIMFEDTEIKFNAGDLIIFPSIFLYPHKVLPVTKGSRYSFISWVY